MTDISSTPSRGPRRSRVKIFIIGTACVLALAAVTVALLPTLISMGLFRGTITAQITGRVQGTVTIGQVVLGWSGPLEVKELVIDDPQNHSTAKVSLQLDQGLWALITDGVGTLSGTITGSVRTRMEPDGSLALMKVIRPAPAGTAAKGGGTGAAGKGAASPVVPAGFNASFAIAGLDITIDAPDGAPFASVHDVTGTLAAHAGGHTGITLQGGATYLSNDGAFKIAAGSDGLIASDGAIAFAGSNLKVNAEATNLRFSADGTAMLLNSATVEVAATDLIGEVTVGVVAKGVVDGSEPSSLEASFTLDKVLSPAGAVVLELGGVRGSITGTHVPTAPLQRLLAGTPVMLARDVGPTLDLKAEFADATGRGLRMTLESAKVSFAAEGSVNADTQAATLSKVTLNAKVHPQLAATAGLIINAPAAVQLTAHDVIVPARGPDGAFPANDLAFTLSATATLPGAAVLYDHDARALGIRAVEFTARAAPIAAGVTFDLTATPTGPETAANAARVTGTLTPGGQFGAYGSLRATAVPTALIDPWLPADMPVQLQQDIGPEITSLALEVGSGAEAAVKVDLQSVNLTLTVDGTLAGDGAVTVSDAALTMAAVRPALLNAYGVQVSGALRVEARASRARMPASGAFDAAALAGSVTARVVPARGETVSVTTGDAGAARTITFASLVLSAGATSLRGSSEFDATIVADGTTLRAHGTAAGLVNAGGQFDIAHAALDATLRAGPLSAGQIAREIPAAADIAPTVGSGMFMLDATYKGSVRQGDLHARVEGGQAVATLTAQMKPDAVAATLEATVPVTRAFLRAVAGDVPVVLGAPATAHAQVSGVTIARSGDWGFGALSGATVALRVPELSLREVEGLASSVKLDALGVDVTVAFAEPMTARGSLRGAVAAVPARGAPMRAADTVVDFTWQGAQGATKQSWGAEVKLENLDGAGLEELLGVAPTSRGQIGSGGTAHMKATQAASGALTFEVDSRIDRLRAAVRGTLQDSVLPLQPSELNLNLPGPQVVAMLNAMNSDNARTWKDAGDLVVDARVQSLRMRVGGGVPADPNAPPTIQLPDGFAAVASAALQPVTLTPVDGQPIRVQTATMNISAPGIGQPATVNGTLELASAGAPAATPSAPAAAPAPAAPGSPAAPAPGGAAIVLNATLKDWTTPAGAVAFDTMQVNGRVTATRASTAVVGALLGMGSELTEALGPEVTADARVTSTGPGVGSMNASIDSEYLTMRAPRVTMKGGYVTVDPDKPVTVRFQPSEPLRERLLEPINPIFTDVRLASPSQRIVLHVPTVMYPLDGDYRKLDADLNLTVGATLMQRNQQNQLLNILKVFQTADNKPIDGLIDPLEVKVRRGQLTYEQFNVYIERQGNTWVTQLIFQGDIDLTQEPPYARSIAAIYPMASVARQMLSNVPAADGGAELQQVFGLAASALNMVQLRIVFSGALGEVNGKPMELTRKIKVDLKPGAIGDGIGDVLKGAGDLFKGILDKNRK